MPISTASASRARSTGLLTLLGIDADPLTSREHILVADAARQRWQQGRALDLAGLIGLIQKPPFARVGVLDLESFYPAEGPPGPGAAS